MKNTTELSYISKKKVGALVMGVWFFVGIIFVSIGDEKEPMENHIVYAMQSEQTTTQTVAIPAQVIIDKSDEINITPSATHPIVDIHKEKQAKINAINIYLKNNNASEEFINLVELVVELSYLNDIDPLRPMSIMIHETGFGHSKAFKENKNVAGINWTDEQKRKMGIRSNVYNLAVEKTHEASVTNLVMLLVDYGNFKKPLVTLSQIQTKYAPSNDPRNGLSGMDNNTWRTHTISHYKNIERIYLSK